DAAGELAAGRRYVVAARPSDRRDDPGRAQSLPETVDRFRCGALEAGLGERIERDQVDLGRASLQQPDELTRLGRTVVDAVEHHVLERDLPACETLRIAPARVEQLRDRVDP